MAKSPDAFRTISEVSQALETPPHVLRFWESKFPQVKPVKRAGGRRYYRPDDITLLGGIKVLLHEQGMTIRGVQKMLKEQGVRHVASLSPPGLADGEAVEGVIVGPWQERAAEEAAERALEAEELEELEGLDSPIPDEEEAEGTPAEATLIEGLLAGTIERIRAEAPRPALPPLPPGEPSLERAVALARRADPGKLAARAGRIAPLLARLRALGGGLPGGA